MARKKLVYLVLDCETATLPYAANYSGEERKRIAIAKPLPYDMSWRLMTREGLEIRRRQFLVSEVFSVPSVFDTAYYKDKRPIYIDKLMKGETILATWDMVAKALLEDLEEADFVGAYNAMFDFCKAIPFMELYISKLYSSNYYEWEKAQNRFCDRIAREKPKRKVGIDMENFNFRGVSRPIFDIWGMACEHLLNNIRYKEECLSRGMLTTSGEYFKTSAETSYRFLSDKYDFDEAHTAMEDVEIESELLAKMLKRHAVTLGIEPFPFRKLGYTDAFVSDYKRKRRKEFAETLYEAFDNYLGEEEAKTAYEHKIERKKNYMMYIMMEE